jgi:hypothetical protein
MSDQHHAEHLVRERVRAALDLADRQRERSEVYRAEANGLLWALSGPVSMEYSPYPLLQAAFERGMADGRAILDAAEAVGKASTV